MNKRRKKMAKQLLKTTDVYQVDTEEEVMEMIEDAKDSQIKNGYTLTKSAYTMKTKKSKGEITDLWYVLSLEKTFGV
jgi:3-dehydroquinate dehydratase